MLQALRTGDRAGALEAALAAYFGPAVYPRQEAIPPALATLFTRFRPGLIRQNILAPSNERRVIYIENQNCNEWTLADDGPDPPVLRDGTVIERERLSGFAVQMVLFEASMGGLPCTDAACIGRAALAKVSADLVEVPLGRWSWPVPGTRFLVTRGLVAHVEEGSADDAEDESWLFVSAASVDHLERLRRIEGITWTGATL
jgi:hypothetical protein